MDKTAKSIGYLSRHYFSLGAVIFILAALVFTSFHSYLLFHTSAEIITTVIAFSTFLFAWNSRRISGNNYFLYIGVVMFFVGVLNFLHMLSYEGMDIIQNGGANWSTQFWIAKRYTLASAFLIAPLFLKRKLNEQLLVGVYMVLTTVVIFLIVYGRFPTAFVQGQGLTPFKVLSEYVISLLFLAAAALMRTIRKMFDRNVYLYLQTSLYCFAITEILFTLYSGVFDFVTIPAHLLNLVAFYLVYKAIVEIGLAKPYNLLFLELKRSEKAKEEILHIVSHEIKNPLTSIRLQTDFLRDEVNETGNRKLKSDLKSIYKDIDKINAILNDLVYTAVYPGEIRVNMEPVDYVDLVTEIVAEGRRIVKPHGISFRRTADEILVRADRNRLTQVINNLLTNAAKYSKEKSTIKVSIYREDDEAVVEISDRGVGIKKQNLDKIFRKYYRTKNARTAAGGSGIGLYLSKQIIDKHKGRIWAVSEPGKGSTFYVSLPILEK